MRYYTVGSFLLYQTRYFFKRAHHWSPGGNLLQLGMIGNFVLLQNDRCCLLVIITFIKPTFYKTVLLKKY